MEVSLGRPIPTFEQYLRMKLGGSGGWRAWHAFFFKPFAAASFADFWRLWNPVYGYFLRYYCFRPLARVMPRPLALLVTFAACGFFLHDLPAWAMTRRVLPPGATIAFVLFGLGAVLAESLRMDLSHWPIGARAASNLAYLAVCVLAMLLIVLRALPLLV